MESNAISLPGTVRPWHEAILMIRQTIAREPLGRLVGDGLGLRLNELPNDLLAKSHTVLGFRGLPLDSLPRPASAKGGCILHCLLPRRHRDPHRAKDAVFAAVGDVMHRVFGEPPQKVALAQNEIGL